MRVMWAGGMEVLRAVLQLLVDADATSCCSRLLRMNNSVMSEGLLAGCTVHVLRAVALVALIDVGRPVLVVASVPNPRFFSPGQWWSPGPALVPSPQSCLWFPWQGTPSQSYKNPFLR